MKQDSKKQLAKAGMAGTLALTVVTALRMKGRFIKNLHAGAGALFTGLALWHHYLYQVEPVSVKPKRQAGKTQLREVKKVEQHAEEREA